MNRKRIKITILIMSISLIGLVGLQLYWIQNAIQVKEANFYSEANQAVSNVILKLERIELTRQLKDPNYGVSPILLIDSINKQITNSLEQKNQKTFRATHDTSYDAHGQITFEFFRKKNNKQSNFAPDTNYIYNEVGAKTIDQIKTLDSNKLQNQSSIYTKLVESLINPNQKKPIENRISKALLDTLLSEEFAHSNINTEYEFGIFQSDNQELILEKTGKYSKELLNNSLVVLNLFPSDIFSSPAYLMIYFPNEKQYLLFKMWFMLLISIILIIIIMGVFSYSIIIIIHQKRLSEMKNDFINNMTHEFKTPISTITLACEALNDVEIKQTKELMHNYITIINEENSRLGKMAEKILQTAVLDKGQLKLKYEEVDIHRIIDDIVKNMDIVIKNKNGVLEKLLLASNSIIFADKIHITNVIYNLIDNAIKYSPNTPKILIKTENSNQGIAINIKDNGIGISKANQKKIFEKLYRVSTGNKHDVKGFGLGLSYVKIITELHSGNISVFSELKKGSTFKLFLPIKK